ncbi:MAG: hypothetical protein MUF31_17920 [Akkermansiaceae bacterium]|nr:hypothetical protein [Akkermansiaceae bacterium]
MAGVRGPCPVCTAEIQAPFPEPVVPQVMYQIPAAEAPASAYAAPPQAPPVYQAPQPVAPPVYPDPPPLAPPVYQAPPAASSYGAPIPGGMPAAYGEAAPAPQASADPVAYAPAPAYAPPPPPYQAPVQQAPAQQAPVQQAAAVASVIPQPAQAAPPPAKENLENLPERPSVKPAPRGIPEPRPPKGITVRHHTSDVPPRGQTAAPGNARSPLAMFARLVVPILLIFAAGTVVYMVIDANRRAGENMGVPQAQPTAGGTGAETPLPSIDAPPAPTPAGTGKVEEAPVVPRPAPEPAPLPAPLPPDPAEVSGALEATRLVEKFLTTTSLEERLPHLEPDLPAKDFEGSFLTGVLPPHEGINPELALRNQAEGFIDFPFVTTFRMPDASDRELMIVVRKRAEEAPRILSRPFFDLLDRRLDAFAAKPVEGPPQEFRAVVEAIPRVFEDGIPDSGDKFTYKLSSSGTGPEILRAYASMKSPLAENLYSPESQLRWGIRLPCTVTLQWNLKEDPAQPYVELKEIRSVGW